MWASKAASRWATSCPIRPSPTTPTVLPKISVPENDERFHACSRSEASAAGIWRAADSSSANACSAALWMFDVGALTTSTPRSVAVFTSTLSRPTPARATIFSLGAASSTSASTVVAERTRSASASGTAASSFSRSGPSTQRTSMSSPKAATVDSASLSAIRTTGRLTRPSLCGDRKRGAAGRSGSPPPSVVAVVPHCAAHVCRYPGESCRQARRQERYPMCWKCDHPDSTMQEWLEAIYASVERNGWVVQFVESDRTPYASTIGLHPRGLPELLVTGMPPQRATQVLNSVAEYLVGGGKPLPGERILIGGELLLDVVQVQHPDAHMNFAVAFYGADLQALQLVWPDDQGHRPWCSEFSNGGVRQPVLGMWVEPPESPDRR